MDGILEIESLGIDFGGLRALDSFSLTVLDREIVGLIGPNGAGKTTVFNLLTNVYQPSRGTIRMNKKNLLGQSTAAVTKCGIARTFQNIRLFKDMTVLDNVRVALNTSMSYSLLSAALRLPSFWKEEKASYDRSLDILKVFDLDQYADQLARSLPYGAQRKLEIARALATNPKVLLLDEPAAGMNQTETAELTQTIRFIRDHYDISILLIEHDMNLVMGICERLIVLDHGIVIATGAPEEVRNDPAVMAAYLGK